MCSLSQRALFLFLFLRRSSTAIISSLFFTVRATRDPLPNYRREDNHPDGLTVSRCPPRRRRAAASSWRESPGVNPVIIIPASNASLEYTTAGSASERGRESFLAKLLTALRISARETLANAAGPSVRQSGPARTGTLRCVPRR